jgi:hypothetical protein
MFDGLTLFDKGGYKYHRYPKIASAVYRGTYLPFSVLSISIAIQKGRNSDTFFSTRTWKWGTRVCGTHLIIALLNSVS